MGTQMKTCIKCRQDKAPDEFLAFGETAIPGRPADVDLDRLMAAAAYLIARRDVIGAF